MTKEEKLAVLAADQEAYEAARTMDYCSNWEERNDSEEEYAYYAAQYDLAERLRQLNIYGISESGYVSEVATLIVEYARSHRAAAQ